MVGGEVPHRLSDGAGAGLCVERHLLGRQVVRVQQGGAMRWLASLLAAYRALRQALKNRMNRSRLASCGPRSHVYGTIDVRAGTCDIQVGADCWLHGLMVVEQAKSRIRIGNNVFVGAATIID